MSAREHPRTTADGPTPAAAQAAGFPVGGEPLAVELADTLITISNGPTDLLGDQGACDRFWSLQSGRLPSGWASPTLRETRHLRDAVRALLDASLERAPLDGAALRAVNAASAAAPISVEVHATNGEPEVRQRWHQAHGARLALAAAARSAIDVLTEPSLRSKLRRCANPACSMLFVTGDHRRQWCTPNICGNRTRVARHYRRHRTEP